MRPPVRSRSLLQSVQQATRHPDTAQVVDDERSLDEIERCVDERAANEDARAVDEQVHGWVTRENARIDWSASAYEVSRHIRAYDPKPGAWSTVSGGDVKLFGARVAPRGRAHSAGDVLKVDDVGMLVACGAGAVRVMAVQPSGKKRLAPVEWSRGRGIAEGDRFDVEPPSHA